MLYFLNCDRCRTEVSVTPPETQRYRSKTCPHCGAELVFANSELREGRLLVVFRCGTLSCTRHGKPQEVPLTRAFLRQACEPDGKDGIFCPACGQETRMTDLEKTNTREMLDEEAAQEPAAR